MKTLYHTAAIALLTIILISMSLIEIRTHVFEQLVGSYLNSQNESRERLDRFVDQEIRTGQALEYANKLIEEKNEEGENLAEEFQILNDHPSETVEVARLERGHKLLMPRSRFVEITNWSSQTDSLFGPVFIEKNDSLYNTENDSLYNTENDSLYNTENDSLYSTENDSLKSWTRTMVVRPGWIRKGEIYMLDDDNYILHHLPITIDDFELIDAYTKALVVLRPEKLDKIYQPNFFFNILESMDAEIMDEIIDPLRFAELESKALRIGVSEEQKIIQIEIMEKGQIELVTIPVSSDLFIELYVALGTL